jgi:uncharacterized protein YybS (DUF2232 family)
MKSIIENFQDLIELQKSIWSKPFPANVPGYLAIVEVPHGFIYATITSSSMEKFKAEVASYPYLFAWKISELEKVTTFLDILLDYLNEEQIEDLEIEDTCFEILIQEIQPFIIHEVNPYAPTS